MRANEFIKKFGWGEAISLLNAQSWTMRQISLSTLTDLKELKKYADAYELVQVHGYEKSKEIVNNAPSDDVYYSWSLGSSGVKDKTVHIGTLKQAITLVEECQ